MAEVWNLRTKIPIIDFADLQRPLDPKFLVKVNEFNLFLSEIHEMRLLTSTDNIKNNNQINNVN